MDKTISITLGGLLFTVTEDAYAKLSAYLEKLKANLSGKYGADEIQSDIEYRIAELCQEIIEKDNRNVLYLNDIESILSQMGDPDEFIEEDENEPSPTAHTKSAKKLFRDGENKYVGGVCAGIAAFLNIDPIIVRVLFLVAFFGFGTGFLVYLILWALLPEAKTASDRLRMKGENVTLKNIQDTIKEKAKEVNTSKNRQRISSFLEEIISACFKVFVILLGTVLIVLGVIGIISIVGFVFGGAFINFNGDNSFFFMPLEWTNLFFAKQSDQTYTLTFGLMISIIPLIIAVILGIQLLFRKNSKALKFIYLSLFGLWLIGVGGAFFSAYTAKQYFNAQQSISTNTSYSIAADTLYLEGKTFKDGKNSTTVHFKDDDEDDEFFLHINKHSLSIEDVSVDILPSPDSLIHVKTTLSAYGSTDKAALNRAKNIKYAVTQTQNKLYFPRFISFPVKDKYRAQKVKSTIYLPEGKVIYLNTSSKDILYDVKNAHNMLDDDMVNHYWKMENGTLQCLNCELTDD